jgi:NADPH2:quinone reductase
MRAVAVRGFRQAPELMDLPKPTAGPGEILVRLGAAGVNPFDWKIIDGTLDGRMPHTFPLIVGVDGAGVVEQVGEGVQRFVVGDGVYGQFLHAPVGIGTYAEYTVAPEGIGIAKTPRGIYTAQAAAVPTAGMTAQQTLDEMGLTKGQLLLILGAAGGVGSFATQLGAVAGLHVIAAARHIDRDALRRLGALEFFDTASASFLDEMRRAHPEGVHGLLDVVHRDADFEKNLALVHEGGVVASTIGAASEAVVRPRGLRGLNIDMHPTPALLERLSAELASGRVRVPVTAQRPLVEGPAAIEESRAGTGRGKTVLLI